MLSSLAHVISGENVALDHAILTVQELTGAQNKTRLNSFYLINQFKVDLCAPLIDLAIKKQN